MSSDKPFHLSIDQNRLHAVLEGYTNRQSETILWLYELMLAEKWNYSDAAKRIKHDWFNISKVFRGEYHGNLNTFVESIQTFKEEWVTTLEDLI